MVIPLSFDASCDFLKSRLSRHFCKQESAFDPSIEKGFAEGIFLALVSTVFDALDYKNRKGQTPARKKLLGEWIDLTRTHFDITQLDELAAFCVYAELYFEAHGFNVRTRWLAESLITLNNGNIADALFTAIKSASESEVCLYKDKVLCAFKSPSKKLSNNEHDFINQLLVQARKLSAADASAAKSRKAKDKNQALVQLVKNIAIELGVWGKQSRKMVAQKLYDSVPNLREHGIGKIDQALKAASHPTKRTGLKKPAPKIENKKINDVPKPRSR